MIAFLSESVRSVVRGCQKAGQRLGQRLSALSLPKLPGGTGSGVLRYALPALLLGCIVLASHGVAFADGEQADYATLAAYNGFGVSVAVIFPILVAALTGVLLPMIVLSIAFAIVYMLWHFARSKAFGSA